MKRIKEETRQNLPRTHRTYVRVSEEGFCHKVLNRIRLCLQIQLYLAGTLDSQNRKISNPHEVVEAAQGLDL